MTSERSEKYRIALNLIEGLSWVECKSCKNSSELAYNIARECLSLEEHEPVTAMNDPYIWRFCYDDNCSEKSANSINMGYSDEKKKVSCFIEKSIYDELKNELIEVKIERDAIQKVLHDRSAEYGAMVGELENERDDLKEELEQANSLKRRINE